MLCVKVHEEVVVHVLPGGFLVLRHPFREDVVYSSRPFQPQGLGLPQEIVRPRISSRVTHLVPDGLADHATIRISLLIRYLAHVVSIDVVRSHCGAWSWDRENARYLQMRKKREVRDVRPSSFWPDSMAVLTSQGDLIVNPLDEDAHVRGSPLGQHSLNLREVSSESFWRLSFAEHPLCFSLASLTSLAHVDLRQKRGVTVSSSEDFTDRFFFIEKCVFPSNGTLTLNASAVYLWDLRLSRRPVQKAHHHLKSDILGYDFLEDTVAFWGPDISNVAVFSLRDESWILSRRIDKEMRTRFVPDRMDIFDLYLKKMIQTKPSGTEKPSQGLGASSSLSLTSSSSSSSSTSRIVVNKEINFFVKGWLDPDDKKRQAIWIRNVRKVSCAPKSFRHVTIGGFLQHKDELRTMNSAMDSFVFGVGKSE